LSSTDGWKKKKRRKKCFSEKYIVVFNPMTSFAVFHWRRGKGGEKKEDKESGRNRQGITTPIFLDERGEKKKKEKETVQEVRKPGISFCRVGTSCKKKKEAKFHFAEKEGEKGEERGREKTRSHSLETAD